MAAYDSPDDTADEVLEPVNPMLLRVTPLPLPLGTLLSCSAGDCEPSGDGRGPCANVLPRVELAPSLRWGSHIGHEGEGIINHGMHQVHMIDPDHKRTDEMAER